MHGDDDVGEGGARVAVGEGGQHGARAGDVLADELLGALDAVALHYCLV